MKNYVQPGNTITLTAPYALASGDGLHVRTGSNTTGGVRDHSFGVEEDAGCWWLTW